MSLSGRIRRGVFWIAVAHTQVDGLRHVQPELHERAQPPGWLRQSARQGAAGRGVSCHV